MARPVPADFVLPALAGVLGVPPMRFVNAAVTHAQELQRNCWYAWVAQREPISPIRNHSFDPDGSQAAGPPYLTKISVPRGATPTTCTVVPGCGGLAET